MAKNTNHAFDTVNRVVTGDREKIIIITTPTTGCSVSTRTRCILLYKSWKCNDANNNHLPSVSISASVSGVGSNPTSGVSVTFTAQFTSKVSKGDECGVSSLSVAVGSWSQGVSFGSHSGGQSVSGSVTGSFAPGAARTAKATLKTSLNHLTNGKCLRKTVSFHRGRSVVKQDNIVLC